MNGESKGSGRQKIDMGWEKRFLDSPELLNRGGDISEIRLSPGGNLLS